MFTNLTLKNIYFQAWDLYNFLKVDGEKGKSFGKCGRCSVVLKNTSQLRMANHRRRCGQGPSNSLSKTIKDFIQTKVDHDDSEPEQQNEAVLWTSPGDGANDYVDESLPIEKVNRTAMEIINDDIRRHRKLQKPASSRTCSQSIDAALSSFLIGCNLTFDIVDSVHFKRFAQKLNSTYQVPTSSQLKQRVISQLSSMESPDRAKSAKKRRRYDSASDESE